MTKSLDQASASGCDRWSSILDGREREGPKRFLGNFEGILQSVGYGAYDHVGGNGIVHAACWAHARRGIVTQMDELF
jgi:hypothetical protein